MKVMRIYSEFARVYHEMYQCIFNYEEDFKLYHKHLSKLKCCKILEIGCGSGNLAKFFLENKYDYTGLDISKEMIDLAKEFVPEGRFIRGDMRDLEIDDEYEAVIVTGRTFTHMTTNHDVMFALNSIHEVLQKEGWLVFDNFNAYEIFTGFKEEMAHKATYDGRKYSRKSKTSFDFEHGWTWKWEAEYKVEDGKEKQTFEDEIMLRAFTEDELRLFLTLNGFKVKEMTSENNAILTVAHKIKEKKTNAQKLYFKQKLNKISET
ncbi:MAG: class I SAM-dependent methyltransferase [Candidatus Heimdallarchaeota archaeon]|nr:class I SAM-dependent methyltransferase [Candidatus Heimdallarchaeota archaeon]MCK4878525.1 class I SAM-dependent methyltransferase [Candidatus Heimdallarchaeota archaeon]